MAINSELKEGEIILYLTSIDKYLSTNLKLLKESVNKNKCYCIYVTINRPYASLAQLFKKEKINTDNILVIDAITPVNPGTRAGNSIFIGNPRALTSISLTITNAVNKLPKNKRVLFLDSISTLLTYNQFGTVTKFSQFLINKMKEWKVSGVILSLEKETDQNLIGQLSQFVDRVIKIK